MRQMLISVLNRNRTERNKTMKNTKLYVSPKCEFIQNRFEDIITESQPLGEGLFGLPNIEIKG